MVPSASVMRADGRRWTEEAVRSDVLRVARHPAFFNQSSPIRILADEDDGLSVSEHLKPVTRAGATQPAAWERDPQSAWRRGVRCLRQSGEGSRIVTR